jgi:hypothetical protein
LIAPRRGTSSRARFVLPRPLRFDRLQDASIGRSLVFRISSDARANASSRC